MHARLVDWLRTRRMMHAEGRYAMVHAGLLPQWSVQKALSLAKEFDECAIRAPITANSLPTCMAAHRSRGAIAHGWDRPARHCHAMTRMRFCTRDGRMEFDAKGV